jgi:hypothetical protein
MRRRLVLFLFAANAALVGSASAGSPQIQHTQTVHNITTFHQQQYRAVQRLNAHHEQQFRAVQRLNAHNRYVFRQNQERWQHEHAAPH